MIQGPDGPFSGTPSDGPQPEKTTEHENLSFTGKAVQSVLRGLREKEPVKQVISPILGSPSFNKEERKKIVKQVIQEIATRHPDTPNLEEENQNIALVMAEMDFVIDDIQEVIGEDNQSRQSIIIEKAKLDAKKNGRKTSEDIRDYDIDGSTPEGQKGLIEIAKLAVQQDGWGASKNIKNFGIEDRNERTSIFLTALENNYESFFLVDEYELDFQKFKNLFPKHTARESIMRNIYPLFIDKLPSLKNELNSVKDYHSNEIAKDKSYLVAALFMVCEIKGFAFEDILKQVNELNELRNPSLRTELGKLLIFNLRKADSVKDLEKFTNLHKGISPYLLICLWPLVEQGADKGVVKELVDAIQAKRTIFKDKFAEQILLQAMSAVAREEALPITDKLEILKFALNEKDKKNTLRLLRGVSSIYRLTGNLSLLKGDQTEEKFSNSYLEAFQSIVPVRNIENFSAKHEKTIGNFRDETALFTYAATLNTLPESERKPLLEKLAVFVSEVLEGTFSSSRYNTEHLDVVFAKREGLKENWSKGIEAPFIQANTEDEPSQSINFQELVETSLNEGHNEKADLPFLQQFIKGEGKQKLIAESKNRKLSKEERVLLQFQQKLIAFSQSKDPKQALSNLGDCLKKMPDVVKGTQLENDIKDWTALLGKNTKSERVGGWKIVDSDDPCDLLLCGTEVKGSCQIVNGSANLNKGLLAYLLDGKNRLLAIKDDKGVIRARSILRLLYDGENPVLFLERTYPAILDKKTEDSMVEFAKKRAEELELPLLSVEVGEGPSCGKAIQSLGGPAPFEYVDATGGVRKYSIWSIDNAHLIQ